MAKKKKAALPAKPDCGSIEMNKIIRAVNEGKENPCTDNQECIDFYSKVLEEKQRTGAYFSLVEPDYYEDALYDSLI